MPIVLGIDGGGTKTTCALARDGQIVASVTTGPSNLVRSSSETVRASIHSAIRGCAKAAGVAPDEIAAACLGLGGASRENIATRIRDIVAEVLTCPVEVIGDMEIAYEAALRGAAGVIVIAGTGSIAYGRNELGETARAGGWGSVISDEGSGYWIGKSAIAAIFHSFDAARPTDLVRAVSEKWNGASPDEIIAIANGTPPARFGELAPAVFETADAGDEIARGILAEAGRELATLAETVIQRLWASPPPVHVAAVGGVFTNSRLVLDAFSDAIRTKHPTAKVTLLTEPPVTGAVFRAEQLLIRVRGGAAS